MTIIGPFARLSRPICFSEDNVYETEEMPCIHRQTNSYHYGSVARNPFDQVLCLGRLLCSTDWVIKVEGSPGDSDVSVCLYFYCSWCWKVELTGVLVWQGQA
jgi:hypothetical protein